MTKPTLLILAAGMGSRYGGLKQIDGVGPSGEAIIEYSIYDAIRAGFGKVVFVIRRDIEAAFKAYFAGKFQDRIEVDYAFQELDMLPNGFSVPEGRTKPWGTGHAVLVARQAISTPFAMINADDFYGAEAFAEMADYLTGDQESKYCLMGYRLDQTLSDHGTVSRGICEVDPQGNLLRVTERTNIGREHGEIRFQEEDGSSHTLAPDTTVSMNMMGFPEDVFDYLEGYFQAFMKERGHELKSEFYIPSLLTNLIESGQEFVKVLPTDAKWFGVTYREDREVVVEALNKLVDQGKYPQNLWA